jgi:hypothetical protein
MLTKAEFARRMLIPTVIVSLFGATVLWANVRAAEESQAFRGLVGKGRADVVRAYGEAETMFYRWDSRYPMEGYAKPRRTNFDEVWVYTRKGSIVYVYLIKDRVVDVFVAGG